MVVALVDNEPEVVDLFHGLHEEQPVLMREEIQLSCWSKTYPLVAAVDTAVVV